MRKKMIVIALSGISLIFFMIVITPLVWMLITSLKDTKEILQYPPSLIPRQPTLSNYFNLFIESNFITYVKNSLSVAISVVILTVATATLGAYSLCRFNYFGKNSVIISSLLGYMIAPIMIVIPFLLIMRWFGLGNTHFALILAHTAFCLPFALWLMKSYIQDIPIEFEKAAQIDGANHLQTIVFVVLPLIAPGLAAVSIFSFILSWNDYIFARILITGDKLKTIPIGIEDMYNATVVDWGLLMSAGVIITIPVLAGFIIINKVFMHQWGSTRLKF